MGCCKSLVRVVALCSEIRKTNHMATISVIRLALHSLWPVRDRAKVRGGGQSHEKSWRMVRSKTRLWSLQARWTNDVTAEQFPENAAPDPVMEDRAEGSLAALPRHSSTDAVIDETQATRSDKSDCGQVSPLQNLRRRRRVLSAEELASIASDFENAWQQISFSKKSPWLHSSLTMQQRGHVSREIPEAEEVCKLYNDLGSLVQFANLFILDRNGAIKALSAAGIDIYEDVGRDWDDHHSFRELSRRHGVTRDTISRWIKITGREVPPRNSKKKYKIDLIVKAYGEKSTTNYAAKSAGVHWQTAQRALKK